MKHIYLVGMRGVGKSFLGKRISTSVHVPLVDLDEYIQKKENVSIAEMVKNHGWDYFREKETEALNYFSEKKEVHCIVTGGGVPVSSKNQEILSQGFVVWVYARPEIVFSRLQKTSSAHRPALTNKGDKEEFFSVYKEREPLYKKLSQFIFYSSGALRQQILQLQRHLLEKNIINTV